MTDPHRLTPDEQATLGTIATRFPGLASAVHAQVTRLLAAVLPAGDGAIATEAQLDTLLGSVVERVVARSGGLRADPPTELDELVDAMVLLPAQGAGMGREVVLPAPALVVMAHLVGVDWPHRAPPDAACRGRRGRFGWRIAPGLLG